MAMWVLTIPYESDQALSSRLELLADIQRLEAERAHEIVRAGDICLCTGDVSRLLGSQLTIRLLQTGTNLVVFPPYPEEQPYRILSDSVEIGFRSIAFKPAKVLNAELQLACGLEELVILYNQAFTTFPGTPVVVTTAGLPVAVHYRHRSTWGSIVLVTLLLGSSSARSIRQHHVAFLTGLTKWLSETETEVQQVPSRKDADQDLRKAEIYPLLILMLSCLPLDRPINNAEIQETYKLVQIRFGNRFSREDWNSIWMDDLENIGLMKRESVTNWQIQGALLVNEISRLRLAAYTRRLM